MRKTCLLLASLTLLFTGCYKDEVESLLTNVDELKGTTIPSMGKQIDAMETSVKQIEATDLKLQEAIATIKTVYLPMIDKSASSVQELSESVQSMMEAEVKLGKSIEDVRNYVDKESANKTWLKENYATLEMQSELQGAISDVNVTLYGINIKLKDIDSTYKDLNKQTISKVREEITKVSKEILDSLSSSEKGILAWIGEQFNAYYTAAKTQEMIDTLSLSVHGKINAIYPSVQENTEDIAENFRQLEKLGNDLSAMADDVTAEYKKMILESFSEQGVEVSEEFLSRISQLNSKLDDNVVEINAKISSISDRVLQLEIGFGGVKIKINTIEGQISSIETSIAGLEKIDSLLKIEINAIKDLNTKRADTLKLADLAILSKIDDLKTFVDDTLKNTGDWAKATFATLKAHDDLQKVVVGIRSKVVAAENNLSYNVQQLKNSISDLETNMKTWVNSQLQEKYDDLNGQITQLRTDIENGDDELKSEILQELSATEASLRTAISDAITTALSQYNGLVTEQIKNKFDSLSKVIDDNRKEILDLIDKLRKEVETNTSNIATIKKQIEKIDSTITELKKVEGTLSEAYKKADGELKEAIGKQISTVQKQIGDLDKYIGSIPDGSQATTVVDWINTTFATLEQERLAYVAFAKLKVQLDSLSDVVTADSTNLAAAIKPIFSTLKGELDDVVSELKDNWITPKFNDYIQLTVYQTKVSEIDAKLAKLKVKDDSLSTEVTKLDQDIAAEFKKLEEEYKTLIERSIKELEGKIDASLAEIKPKVVALGGRVDDLEKISKTLAEKVGECEADIIKIKAKLNGIPENKTVKAFIEDIGNKLDSLISKNAVDIDTLEKAVSRIKVETDKVAGLVTRMDQVATNLSGLLTSYQNLDGNFTTLTTNINALKDRYETLTKDSSLTIAQLEAKLKAIEDLTDTQMEIYKRLKAIADAIGSIPEGKTVAALLDELDDAITALKDGDETTIKNLNDRLKKLEEATDTSVEIIKKVKTFEAKLGNIAEGETVKGLIAKSDWETNLSTAIKNLIDGSGDKTLKALEDRIVTLETALENISTNPELLDALKTKIEEQVDSDIVGDASEDYDTLKEIEDAILALDEKIKALANDFPTLSFIPEYTDGSVDLIDEKVTLKFQIVPASAAEALASSDVSVLAYKTTTRSVSGDSKKITNVEKKIENGVLSLTATLTGTDVKSGILRGDKYRFYAVVKNNSVTAFTSAFIPVNFYPVETVKIKTRSGFGADNSIILGKQCEAYVEINEGRPYSLYSDITWSSNPSANLSITPDGLSATIVGTAPGNVSLIAKAGSVQDQLAVFVKSPATEITLSPEILYIPVNGTSKITPTLKPEGCTEAVTYTVTNGNTGAAATGISVAADGTVKAEAKGYYKVTGMVHDESGAELTSTIEIVAFDFAISGSFTQFIGINYIYAGESVTFTTEPQFTDTPQNLKDNFPATNFLWSVYHLDTDLSSKTIAWSSGKSVTATNNTSGSLFPCHVDLTYNIDGTNRVSKTL